MDPHGVPRVPRIQRWSAGAVPLSGLSGADPPGVLETVAAAPRWGKAIGKPGENHGKIFKDCGMWWIFGFWTLTNWFILVPSGVFWQSYVFKYQAVIKNTGGRQLRVFAEEWLRETLKLFLRLYGYGSIPINTIFRGMNIHLPAILMFTRGTRFWHITI